MRERTRAGRVGGGKGQHTRGEEEVEARGGWEVARGGALQHHWVLGEGGRGTERKVS